MTALLSLLSVDDTDSILHKDEEELFSFIAGPRYWGSKYLPLCRIVLKNNRNHGSVLMTKLFLIAGNLYP